MADEIKAKIIIEADTSGAEEAAAALEKLQGATGAAEEGAGGLGDVLAAQEKQASATAAEVAGLAEETGGLEEAANSGEEAVSNFNDTLGEHQQALEGAATAHEELQPAIEETNKSLSSAQETLAKSTPVVSQYADNIQSVQQAMDEFNQSDPWTNMANAVDNAGQSLSYSQIFNPENIKSNMAAFNEAINSPDVTDPLGHIQTYLDQTGQSWENFTSTIGEGRMNTLYDMVDQLGGTYQVLGGVSDGFDQAGKSAGTFIDNTQTAQQAMDEFNQADPWAAFNAGAGDASKAVESTGSAIEDVNKVASGGFFGSLFGEGGTLSDVGGGVSDFFGGIGQSFGDLVTGFEQFARPLMMLQMVGQMASGVASWIYNANLANEGGAAGGTYTYTSQVNDMMANIQRSGDALAVGIGQGLLPSIEGANDAAAKAGASTDAWKNIGDAIGGTFGFIGDALSISGGLLGMGAGGIAGLLTGNYSLEQGSANLFTSGGEGMANAIAKVLGQPLPYASTAYTGSMPWNPNVAPYLNADTSNLTAGGSNYLTNPLSPYYGMDAQTAQAAWTQSHYTGTYGPSDPMNAYEHAIAMNYQTGTAGPVPAPSNDIGLDQLYFGSMPYGTPGPSYGGSGGYGGTITRQDVANANLQPGGFSNFTDPAAWSKLGSSILDGSLFSQIGNAFQNSAIGQDWNEIFGGGGGGRGMGAGGSFDGGCFVAGTRVLLANGTEKSIEQLRTNDQVVGYDGKKAIPATILSCITFPHKQTYELTFSDGNTLTLTDSHPLYSPDTGWRSLSPAMTREESPDLPISQLQIGDVISTVNGTCTLVTIEKRQIEQVYNISLSGPHTYYANRVLVHNPKAGSLGGVGAQSIGSQIADQIGSIQLPHIDLGGIASSIGGAFSGIQLPHLDLGGIASGIGGAFSGLQLPHLDLGGMASSLGGAFSGIQLPHLDLGGIASSLGGAFSGIELPHLDLGGIGSALSGAFSGITMPHIPDLGGMINGALGGMFSGISIPSVPDLGGMINGALGGMFSGISMPSIPDLGGMINGALGGMFSGISMPSIPNLGGMINGALGGMFGGITLPSIPDVGGMLNGALGGMFGNVTLPAVPDVGAMINGALGGMFSSITMPPIPNVSAMINGALGGMFSGISIPGFAGGVENFGGGAAFIAEQGPELVMLPSGSSVYPLSTGASVGGGMSPISLGGGGGGTQMANITLMLDSQAIIQALGIPLSSSIRLGMGLRGF